MVDTNSGHQFDHRDKLIIPDGFGEAEIDSTYFTCCIIGCNADFVGPDCVECDVKGLFFCEAHSTHFVHAPTTSRIQRNVIEYPHGTPVASQFGPRVIKAAFFRYYCC